MLRRWVKIEPKFNVSYFGSQLQMNRDLVSGAPFWENMFWESPEFGIESICPIK